MEKLITVVPNTETNKLVAEIDGQKVTLETCVVVQSWDKANQGWFWKINVEDPKSDPRIRNAKFLVSTELYRDGELEYAGRDVAIGKNGTGIILGSGKPYVRAVDISVAEFMRANKVATLMKTPPSTDRIRTKGSTITFKVFGLDGKEVKPVAGSFMLDPEQVWVVEHRRVQLSNHSEWKGLYIPNGWKFKKEEPKTEPAKVEVKPEQGIVHEEEAVMEPNSSEEAFTTLGAQVGDQLDQAIPEKESEPAEVKAEQPAETLAEPAQPVEQPTPVEQAGVALDVPAVTAQA